MSSLLSAAIADLYSPDVVMRVAAATEIYRRGRAPADRAAYKWWSDPEFAGLFGGNPAVIVGLAVRRGTFAKIREANGAPLLVEVPPDQDAEEFELHFPDNISLDVLTTRDPDGQGAVARYLGKFGEGVQQVEFRCTNVDRATEIVRTKFGVVPVYPRTRLGAGGTRVNFFLVPSPGPDASPGAGSGPGSGPTSGKVLLEFFETPRIRE